MVKVNSVISGSPAEKMGVQEGDLLACINGHKVKDVLDYMYYAAETEVTLDIVRHGEELTIHIQKDEYDDLGLEFETFLMDSKQRCSNNCVFCFIDQMPPGMRETLYFKDDDARLSFLQGNYVTLTNLKQEDIDRIIKMKLNINVSVHTTNPELRVKMMHNRFAGEKLKFIWQLAESGIKLNCQVVCCPGLNDGDELRRTLSDLGTLMPNITSMAVVPVGGHPVRRSSDGRGDGRIAVRGERGGHGNVMRFTRQRGSADFPRPAHGHKRGSRNAMRQRPVIPAAAPAQTVPPRIDEQGGKQDQRRGFENVRGQRSA